MNNYQHHFIDGKSFSQPLGKIVCVGRNYADHARELNNPIPTQPLLFIKPATAAVDLHQPIAIPSNQGECHHELEMAVLIGSSFTSEDEAALDLNAVIAGVGLGLDLTLRDLQSQLKKKAQPWERAKGFDGSCPLSQFKPYRGEDLQNIELRLFRNKQLQQSGNTADMLFSVRELLLDINRSFSLLPGDVVMTGTPAGVGPLVSGDSLKLELGHRISLVTSVL